MRYFLPSVICSVLLNIPTIMRMTLMENWSQDDREQLRFSLIYQVFHPILTTSVLPIVVLLLINIRIHAKIPNRLSRSRSNR